jgi:hypothetical protein
LILLENLPTLNEKNPQNLKNIYFSFLNLKISLFFVLYAEFNCKIKKIFSKICILLLCWQYFMGAFICNYSSANNTSNDF